MDWYARRRGDRLRRRHVRAAGPLLLPRRAPLRPRRCGAGDGRSRSTWPTLRRRPTQPARQEAASLVARGLTTRILTRMARKEKQQSTAPKKQGRLGQIRQVYTRGSPGRPPHRLVDAAWRSWARSWSPSASASLVGHWPYALVLGLPSGPARRDPRPEPPRRARGLQRDRGAARCRRGRSARDRRGWFYEQQPVALEGARGTRPEDMVNAAFVFRAVGRSGHRPHRRGAAGSGVQAAGRRAQEGRARGSWRARHPAPGRRRCTARSRSASSRARSPA